MILLSDLLMDVPGALDEPRGRARGERAQLLRGHLLDLPGQVRGTTVTREGPAPPGPPHTNGPWAMGHG